MSFSLLLIKSVVLANLACWLSIACLNNVLDRTTNRHLLWNMLSMRLLQEDGTLGQGLLERSWSRSEKVNILLWIIVSAQSIIALMLWIAAIVMAASLLKNEYLSSAMMIANWALLGFMMLWSVFLCGGLWFGYWIKTPKIQITHFLLLLLSLLAISVLNLPL